VKDPKPAKIEILTLRVSKENVAAWSRLLTAEEIARADRFRQTEDRLRCILGRGLLRQALGRALDLAPEVVSFGVNAHGKPTLADPSEIAFNLAHSGDYVMAAVGRARAVGVDVERHRPDLDALAVGRQVFTAGELAVIAAAPPEQRHDLFFRQWTFKEAVVKAVGIGLSLDLKRFEVVFSGEPRLVSHGVEELGDPADWRLTTLPVDPGYSAALAVQLWDRG
jgi:4'-phosphopantetheinyl transferase